MKKIYNVAFAFSIIAIFLFNVDIVYAVKTNYEKIPPEEKGSIWLGKKNGTGVGRDRNQLSASNCHWKYEKDKDTGDYSCRFREGRLKIDNKDAFCANPAIHFGVDKVVVGRSLVDYLQSDAKISKNEAQRVVTEIALYKKFIYGSNLSSTQKYYLTQTRVWTVLHRYYGWFGERNANNMNYWVEVWNNNSIFNGTYGTKVCHECPNTSEAFINNTNWEGWYFDHAKEYVDQNIDKYTGEGKVWVTKERGYQPLIQVDSLNLKLKASYDYSVDAACVGCDVKGLENRAMIIQDTTDWEAIMNSKSSSSPKAQGYYYGPDSGSYCREEYRVKLPDSSKEITVKPGKYLTVGALKKELEKLTKGTANVGPIEVTKIIQCKGGDLNKRRTVNEQNYFVSASKHKSLGTITLKYEECGDNRRYNKEPIPLVPNFKEGVPSVNSSISNGMLTQSQTVSYTLPSNTYRYVRNQDGLSIKDISSIKANELNTKYRDLGISTLPISFDNEGDSVKVKANLHFEYTLPEHKTHKTDGGAYSYIKDAYDNKNYFKSSGNAADNVYKKYTKGDAKAKTQINESACNKLYGTTNQACINSHVNDKTADCKKINKISSDKNGSCEKAYSQTGYVCPVKIPPIPPCPPCKDIPCENGKERCVDGTCPVDGEECPRIVPPPCEDDDFCDPGTIKVIYRPIDLANPFPGQKGSKTKSRKTGANWCEYNQKTGEINCSANNAVSKKYIINKKVYNDNHVLYKVTLDANTISKVRNYNKNKKYDDFDLKCKDGKACISDFLNNVINVEGKCSKVNHGNFYTCNK